ncbi:hypothetical protein [Pseudonocardia halophobica]|uniref:hypothetical protein n=1 Tax=Pseudonocardia halophobica TaxID=29401 RepID=UPI001E37BBFA|nr:hypothetical protein [Pseudonocardia halophobica]
MIQRRDNQQPPGGVLELEQTFEAGVRHAVLEETGVEVEVERLSRGLQEPSPQHRRNGLPLPPPKRRRREHRRGPRHRLADRRRDHRADGSGPTRCASPMSFSRRAWSLAPTTAPTSSALEPGPPVVSAFGDQGATLDPVPLRRSASLTAHPRATRSTGGGLGRLSTRRSTEALAGSPGRIARKPRGRPQSRSNGT